MLMDCFTLVLACRLYGCGVQSALVYSAGVALVGFIVMLMLSVDADHTVVLVHTTRGHPGNKMNMKFCKTLEWCGKSKTTCGNNS